MPSLALTTLVSATIVLNVTISDTIEKNATANMTNGTTGVFNITDDDDDYYESNITNATIEVRENDFDFENIYNDSNINNTNTTGDSDTYNRKNDGYLGLIVLILVMTSPCYCLCLFWVKQSCSCINDCISAYNIHMALKHHKRDISKQIRENGIVNKKLTKEFIAKLNAANRECQIEKTKREDNNCCSICLDNIKFDTKKVWASKRDIKKNVYLNCGHNFHKKCLQQWVTSKVNEEVPPSCPVCRSVIVELPKSLSEMINNDIFTRYEYRSGYSSDSSGYSGDY